MMGISAGRTYYKPSHYHFGELLRSTWRTRSGPQTYCDSASPNTVHCPLFSHKIRYEGSPATGPMAIFLASPLLTVVSGSSASITASLLALPRYLNHRTSSSLNHSEALLLGACLQMVRTLPAACPCILPPNISHLGSWLSSTSVLPQLHRKRYLSLWSLCLVSTGPTERGWNPVPTLDVVSNLTSFKRRASSRSSWLTIADSTSSVGVFSTLDSI